MNPWYVLQIQKTTDKNAIKEAYMALLPNFNPEVDADGFTNLRLAYEAALEEAEGKAKTSGIPAVDVFFENLQKLYDDFPRRITLSAWEDALKDEVCVALDTEEAVDHSMLEFLARNNFLPNKVWKLLNQRFLWAQREEALQKNYHPGFIQFLIKNANSPFDIQYDLIKHEANVSIDEYLIKRQQCVDAMDRNSTEEALTFLDDFTSMGVQHPLNDIERARHLAITNQPKEAEALMEKVREIPAFQDEPYALYVWGIVLSAFETEEDKQEAARAAFTRADEIVGGYFFAQMGIVDTHIKQKQLDEAEEYILKTMMPSDPTNYYTLSYLHKINALQLEDYKSKDNLTSNEKEKMADCYINAGDFQAAIDLLRDVEKTGHGYHAMASAYINLQDIQRAEECALESIKMEPTYSNHLTLANIYNTQRMYEKAQQTATQALEKKLNDENLPEVKIARIKNAKAYALYKTGQLKSALEIINEALTTQPRMGELYASKSEVLMYMGRYEEACAETEQALYSLPMWPFPYEIQAEIFYSTGNFEQMGEVFTRVEEINVKSNGLDYFKACRTAAMGNFEEAKKMFDDLLTQPRLGEWEERALGALFHYNRENHGDPEEIIHYATRFKDFFEKNGYPPDYRAYMYLYEAHMDIDEEDAAVSALQAGLTALPNHIRLLMELAFHFRHTDVEESLRLWEQVITLDPGNETSYNQISFIHQDNNEDDLALQALDCGLAHIPQSRNLLGAKAVLYDNMEQYNQAVEFFLLAIEAKETRDCWRDSASLYFDVGKLYWREFSDKENSEKYLQLAYEEGIDDPWRLGFIGNMYLTIKKNYEQAIAIFTQCTEDDPEDLYAYMQIGEAYRKLGDEKKAMDAYNKAINTGLKLKDNHHDIYSNIAAGYIAINELTKGEKYILKAEKLVKTDGTPKGGRCHCIPHRWAQLYNAKGNKAKAIAQIDIAISIANSVGMNAFKEELLQG